jgi:hypothetical protein
MQSALPERYPHWREVYPVMRRPPDTAGTGTGKNEQLRQKQEQLASLCLTSVTAHRQFVTSLKASITNENQLKDS